MTEETATSRMRRSFTEAAGFIELAQMSEGDGKQVLIQAALRSLRRVSDDDELIDALYDADMRADRAEAEKGGA